MGARRPCMGKGGGGVDVCPTGYYIFSGNEITPKKNILVAIISVPYYQAADWIVVSNSFYNQPHLQLQQSPCEGENNARSKASLNERGKKKRRKKSERSYNLGENKWNIWTTPPPHFNDAKNGAFLPLPAFIIALWRKGVNCSFFVQDCRPEE